MEDIAKFVGEIVEFIVGGVFFLASLVLVAIAVAPSSVDDVLDEIEAAPDGWSSVILITALSVVYTLGIVAEGLSRGLFEPTLARLTNENETLIKDPGGVDLVFLRERWRLNVMLSSPQLYVLVEGQLKRLRIERTLFLSALVSAIALMISADWLAAAALWVLTGASLWLVVKRLGRYLNTIVAAHQVMLERASSGGVAP